MKTQKSLIVVGIALVIASGVMLNVRPKSHAVTRPLDLGTQTAQAANPCYMTTITASAGANCSMHGGSLPTNMELPYEDGWSFSAFYEDGCAPWGGFTVAVIRSYVWIIPGDPNQSGHWQFQGSWPITLEQGWESTSGLLHNSHLPDCSYAMGSYQELQHYAPCK